MNDFHMADSGPWTLGTLIWLPVLLALLVAAAVAATYLYRYARSASGGYYSDATEARWLAHGIVAVAAALIAGTLSPMGMYPYKAEYHQWREVSGTVDKIDRRLIGSGKGMEDKFVVRFEDSNGAQFGCDDTRCASVEEGDHLALSCKRVWQYTGTDGYDCRFVSTEVAA